MWHARFVVAARVAMRRTATLVLLALLMAAPLWAAEDETELAKKTQNPVADLISIPLQNNFNFGVGPNNVTQYVGNIQPVIPFKLTEEWNLIIRTILPIINQPSPAPGVSSNFGLGDLNPTLFFSPRKPGALIWGVGPTFTVPTATDTALGSGKWSMGPAAVVLTMQGPWVIGALINQQWSVAGDAGRRSVNQMLIHPLRELQLAGWLVPHELAHHHGQLDGGQREPVDGAAGWRVRQALAGRQGRVAGEHPALGVLQPREAGRGGRLVLALLGAGAAAEVSTR